MLKKKLIKIQFLNEKTRFENAETQKTAQVLAQVFLDRCSKKPCMKLKPGIFVISMDSKTGQSTLQACHLLK